MKKILSLALALTLMLGITSCGSTQSGSGSASSSPSSSVGDDWDGITLKLSHTLASTDLLNVNLEAAAEKISERTNGKVEIQLYPNGELLSYADAVEAISSDSAVIYFCAFGDWVDFYPDAFAYCSGFEFSSVEQYEKFMETPEFQEAVDALAAKNIYLLQGGYIAGFRQVLTNKPINSMADLKGLSIRVPAVGYFIECFEDLGMTPIGMAWSETLTAASQGSIDSVEATYSTMVNSNLWDYFSDITETNHVIQADNLWMSYNVWNSIPEEYQTIIKEELGAARETYVQQSKDAVDSMRQQCIDHNMTVNSTIDLTEFKEATSDNMLAYSNGQKILDVLNTLQ